MRNYSDLSRSDKLEAILSCVKEPVTIEFAVDLGEIEGLTNDEIDEIINSPLIERKEDKVWVKLELQADTIERLEVDPKAVHGQIADKLWKDLGMDEITEGFE